MLLKDKKIAVVGGGPSGLTIARLLQQAGAHIKVYERDLDKNARVQGASLDLHDNSGLAALRKAGLIEKFQENYMVGADRERIMDPQGKIHYSDHEKIQNEDFGQAHFRPEIDRGVLRRILLESLASDTVVWNSHFISMEKQNEGWLLHFKNQKDMYADLVIAADGANSKIRSYITDIKALYSGITMLEGNIKHPQETSPNIHNLLNGGKIMAFGDKKNILMGQKGNGEIGYYLSFKKEEDWYKNNGINYNNSSEILDWYRKEYQDWNPMWDELFETVILPFIPRPIYYMPLDQQWNTQSNIMMIGDAAHLMPPFAGEGVNMAMLDALDLSESLLSDQFTSIHDAIHNFEINMFPRASAITKESLENGEKMHSEKALENMLAFFSNI